MPNTLSEKIQERDIFYYRQRLKNRVFGEFVKFFAELHKTTGITKKDIALKLDCHPSQVTRWLSNPSNMTLETISDILLAANAELEKIKIVKFSDQKRANYANDLYSKIISECALGEKSSVKQITIISTNQPNVMKGIDISSVSTPRTSILINAPAR